jgi:hypothetical protein
VRVRTELVVDGHVAASIPVRSGALYIRRFPVARILALREKRSQLALSWRKQLLTDIGAGPAG